MSTMLTRTKTNGQPGTRRAARPTGGRRRLLIAIAFLSPALILLGALVIYPIVYTVIRSTFGADESQFVGVDNYIDMFRNDSTFTAIRNNLLWVIVAPFACTALGLIFAVLLDRVRWAAAFKLIIFMPMAISMLAAGVIFRGMFQQNPNLGVVNAIIVGVQKAVQGTSGYPGATPRNPDELLASTEGLTTASPITSGDQVQIPLVGIRSGDVPEAAIPATQSASAAGDEITGTIWLDNVPGGGGEPGQLDAGERGLPGVLIQALTDDGSVAAHATTTADGQFALTGLDPGSTYDLILPMQNFASSAEGIPWLGPALINVVVILAYVWIWAGFAMVMIAAGLSAIDRSLLEAARMDGAGEWKLFTRITAPLLSPVLIVVFVTLMINVLKIFDLVYVIPPGASRPAANVIAVEMWTVSFGGGNNQGLGSALAILLLLLVVPSMIINVRRIREERNR